MGPSQKLLTQVGLGQFLMALVGLSRVGSAIYGLGFDLENFP